MKSPAHALALFLVSENFGTFGGTGTWIIGIAREPTGQDNTITLYDTPGFSPLLYGDPTTGAGALYRPSIQVRVRSDSYPDAYDMQERIRALFHKQTGVTIGDGVVVGIWLTSDIQDLGRDDNDRFRLTANYQLTRQEI